MSVRTTAQLAMGAVSALCGAIMMMSSGGAIAGGVNVRDIRTPAERCAQYSGSYQRYQTCLSNARQKYEEALARRLENDLEQCGTRGNGEDSNKAIECRCTLDPSRRECSASKS